MKLVRNLCQLKLQNEIGQLDDIPAGVAPAYAWTSLTDITTTIQNYLVMSMEQLQDQLMQTDIASQLLQSTPFDDGVEES